MSEVKKQSRESAFDYQFGITPKLAVLGIFMGGLVIAKSFGFKDKLHTEQDNGVSENENI